MRVLIAQVNRLGLSDTFIRAHVERLQADVVLSWGSLGNVDGERRLPRAAITLGRTLGAFLAREPAPSGWAAKCAERGFYDVIRRTSVDVVLAEYGPVGVRVMRACARARVPFVVHFHGFDASRRDVLARYAAEYRAMFRAAYAVVGVSHDMNRHLRELGAPPDKLVYSPYGVDLEHFQGAAPDRAPRTFLAVGRFVGKKAPDVTLRAFASVYLQRPDARLRMVGDGPLLEPCRRLAQTLGIADAVSFLGGRSHEEVRAEMRSARAFVQHSVEAESGDREGTPVAILEASASGLPVVATRHAGIPEVVVDEATGLLVDEGDERGMSARMLRLADDAQLAATLGAAARRRIAARYTMARSISRLQAILAAAAAGRPLPSDDDAERP